MSWFSKLVACSAPVFDLHSPPFRASLPQQPFDVFLRYFRQNCLKYKCNPKVQQSPQHFPRKMSQFSRFAHQCIVKSTGAMVDRFCADAKHRSPMFSVELPRRICKTMYTKIMSVIMIVCFEVLLQVQSQKSGFPRVGDKAENHEHDVVWGSNPLKLDLTSAPWSRIVPSPLWKSLSKISSVKMS